MNIDALKNDERRAWEELTAHIDFTDKCKRRAYTGRKAYSPEPVPDVEAEFRAKFRAWEKARAALHEASGYFRSQVRNGTQPEESGSRPRPSRL